MPGSNGPEDPAWGAAIGSLSNRGMGVLRMTLDRMSWLDAADCDELEHAIVVENSEEAALCVLLPHSPEVENTMHIQRKLPFGCVRW